MRSRSFPALSSAVQAFFAAFALCVLGGISPADILSVVLFGAALLGGSAGAWAGMYLFHHKTKHWYFVVGMPLILAAQLAAGVWLAGNSGLV